MNLIASHQTLSAFAYFHLPQHIDILQDFCRSYNAIGCMRFLVKLLLLAIVVAVAYSNNVTAVLSLSLDTCYGKRTPLSSGWHASFLFRRCKFTSRPEDWLFWPIFEASLSSPHPDKFRLCAPNYANVAATQIPTSSLVTDNTTIVHHRIWASDDVATSIS